MEYARFIEKGITLQGTGTFEEVLKKEKSRLEKEVLWSYLLLQLDQDAEVYFNLNNIIKRDLRLLARVYDCFLFEEVSGNLDEETARRYATLIRICEPSFHVETIRVYMETIISEELEEPFSTFNIYFIRPFTEGGYKISSELNIYYLLSDFIWEGPKNISKNELEKRRCDFFEKLANKLSLGEFSLLEPNSK